MRSKLKMRRILKRKSNYSYPGEPIFAENLILGFDTAANSHFFECPYCHLWYHYHDSACECRDKCYASLLGVSVDRLIKKPELSDFKVKCRFCGKRHDPLSKEALNCRDFHVYLKYFALYSHLLSRQLLKRRKNAL